MPVFMFTIQQLSSFKVPTWFIDLTVATCSHIQYTEFMSILEKKNEKKMEQNENK